MEGEAGDFTVSLTRKPRYIIEEKCTGCTTCVEYCPVHYPDQFNQEISDNKAVHIYFAQAIPLIAYIDESCLYLKERKCRFCEGVCQNNAIDLKQKEKKEYEQRRQAALKHRKDIQTKEVQARMKETKQRSDHYNKGKKEPFYKNLFNRKKKKRN